MRMRLPVTYLFVPGDRPERFDKAQASGADAVIFDLEDAVAPDDKDRARANVREWVALHRKIALRAVVRINGATTPWFDADVDLLRQGGLAFAMLPKAEIAESIVAVTAALPAAGGVLPLIETARGVENVSAIAAARGVQRLVFGTLDYAADLDLSGDERGLHYPAARIALASRCAGLASPVGGVTPGIDDEARLLSDLAFGRAFGFGAKLCIHPRQVAVIHKAMQPTRAEIEWATRVLAAATDAPGAVQVDGRMVDRPVLLKARAILERAPPAPRNP
jgi:citrate lyase subunit beta/citryl-CoA lyase